MHLLAENCSNGLGGEEGKPERRGSLKQSRDSSHSHLQQGAGVWTWFTLSTNGSSVETLGPQGGGLSDRTFKV